MLGFLDLFKTPNMRKKTLIIYYLWFASTFVYYGLTLNSNGFGASLFVSFMIGKGDWQSNMLYHFSSISSVADKIFSNSHWVTNGHAWDFADFKSRKKIVIDFAVFNLWSGTVTYNGNTKVSCYPICPHLKKCLLCFLIKLHVLNRGVYPNEWPIVALNILGRGCSVGCLSLCYVLAAEVFPTITRNVGLGSSSLWVKRPSLWALSNVLFLLINVGEKFISGQGWTNDYTICSRLGWLWPSCSNSLFRGNCIVGSVSQSMLFLKQLRNRNLNFLTSTSLPTNYVPAFWWPSYPRLPTRSCLTP